MALATHNQTCYFLSEARIVYAEMGYKPVVPETMDGVVDDVPYALFVFDTGFEKIVEGEAAFEVFLNAFPDALGYFEFEDETVDTHYGQDV